MKNAKGLDSAADEVRAYDLLEMLMRLHGVKMTLDVLLYWYVVSSLSGKRRGEHSAADGHKRETV